MQLAKRTERGPARGTLHAQTLQYLLWLERGRNADALKSLEAVRSSEWQYASLANYDQIISSSLGQNKVTQARHFLRRGQEAWGNDLMAPLEITVALREKKLEQAQAAYRRCQSSKSSALKAQCEQHIGHFKPTDEEKQLLPGLTLPKFGGV